MYIYFHNSVYFTSKISHIFFQVISLSLSYYEQSQTSPHSSLGVGLSLFLVQGQVRLRGLDLCASALQQGHVQEGRCLSFIYLFYLFFNKLKALTADCQNMSNSS